MDTVAELTCLWLLGWIFVSLSGSDVLLPESFALLPIDRRRLAFGLLIASFVGILPAATIVAFSGLVLTSLPLGPAPTLVALIATALILPMVIVLAKVIVALAGQAANARFGLELAGLQSGLLIALIWIWIPIAAVSGVEHVAGIVGARPGVDRARRADRLGRRRGRGSDPIGLALS